MPRYHYFDGDTFERNGRTFEVNHPYDDSGRVPWEDDDGLGIVSDWERRNKAPGERILCEDRSSKRFFDFAGTIAKAKKDGWGLCPEDLAKLESKLGHKPSKGEIAAEATEKEFEFLRSWCNDEWQYVGVVVTHIPDPDYPDEKGDSQSLWGIESCSTDYLRDVAHELADALCHDLNKATADEIEATWESVTN